MKVKRSSWHYKLYCFWRQSWDWDSYSPFEAFELLVRRSSLRSYAPNSLCRYFWFILGATVVSSLVLLALNVVIVLVCLLGWPVAVVAEKWADRRTRKYGDTPRSPGLLRSFVKAKKSRICPLIEVVD